MAYDKVVDSTVLDGLFTAIANAIRGKNGSSDTYTPAQMPQAIAAIPSGGGIPQELQDLLSGCASGDIDITLDETMFGFSVYLCQDSTYIPRGNRNVTSLTLRGVKYLGDTNSSYGGFRFSNNPLTNLTAINLPDTISVFISKSSTNAAPGNLQSFKAPKLTETIPSAFFRACTTLTEVDLKALYGINNNTFYGCTGVTKLEFDDAMSIGSNAFNGCSSLMALILRKTIGGITTLSNASALMNTPIAAGTGYIYVPSALKSTYESASNWVTYAAQFRAIEDYPEITGGL